MLKITMLGLALAAFALSGAMVTAGAETIPSPLAQVRDRVQVDDVACNEGHMLMLSPSGNPACVFSPPCMLELRGFVQADRPHHITCKELRDDFGIRIVTDLDEMPPPFGNGRYTTFLNDYETGLEH